jgi:hypothetical protein
VASQTSSSGTGDADAKDVTRLNSTSSFAHGPSVEALLDAAKADASGEDEERRSTSKPPRRPARLAHAEVSAK